MLLGSTILEVAIGMIFVYLLMSLLCSAVNEYIESKLNNRAKDLERGIRLLLNDPKPGDARGNDNASQPSGLAGMLYGHPLVKALYRDANRLPSYIPSRTFALALWNMATTSAEGSGAAGVTTNLQTIRATVAARVPDEEVKRALLTLIDEAGNDIEKARKNIEDWYDAAMDRVSGWYKRRVQYILLAIGFIVSIAINADTITIGKALASDGTLRSAVVASAEAAALNPQPDDPNQTPEEKIEATRAQLYQLGLPIGWAFDKDYTQDPRGVPQDFRGDGVFGWLLLKLFGLALTGLAISQGAPFWFDLLNKFMVIRSTVKPSEKSQNQPSKDKPAPRTEIERRPNEEEEGNV
ncbi:MAG TPA: hypothetical protein VF666_20345 [Pyrinomonadaceae bacterium]|jgi:hypothetical protein